MAHRYSDVISRTLSSRERRVPTNQQEETPFVIQPLASSSALFLREFLGRHSSSLREDIARFGAILLRGFDVELRGGFSGGGPARCGVRGQNDA